MIYPDRIPALGLAPFELLLCGAVQYGTAPPAVLESDRIGSSQPNLRQLRRPHSLSATVEVRVLISNSDASKGALNDG